MSPSHKLGSLLVVTLAFRSDNGVQNLDLQFKYYVLVFVSYEKK